MYIYLFNKQSIHNTPSIPERPILLRGLHGGNPALLHDHGQAHDAQDADADGGRERVQELLHHLRHVPAGVLLRARRDYRVREC